ncbi:MAG TPA: hypothetical protein VHO03_17320 [Ignavibacteriales bacterium]|nr:hypothetical protein [Ignavibacteriales bacterium]
MATRNPNDLRPDVQQLYTELSRKLKDIRIDHLLINVARKAVEQLAYWSQGRKPLEIVNGYRRQAGLAPITAVENKKIVTWTLESKHVVDDNNPKSRAFDIVILQGAKPVWATTADTNGDHHPDYEQAGLLWESLSPKCRWGGRFNDPGHFEVV